MQRPWLGLVGIIVLTASGGLGCQSCSTCHDYDPPVAGCDACGCQRAGSASGGPINVEYAGDDYAEGQMTTPYEDAPALDDATSAP